MAGWHLFHEMGQPTFALVVGSPKERTNHLGGWEGFLKLEKNRLISDILVQEIVEYQTHVWVGGRASMDWDLGLGVKMWFLLALRKGCLLLMPFTKCLLQMQQPPFG